MYDGEDKVFDETGMLIGIITESYENGCRLTHMAIFQDGSMFVTNDDITCITDLVYDDEGHPLVDENLQPCAFQTTELMTKILIAKGFFKKISEVGVAAEGIVDNCNKRNEFELGGYLLFK